MAVAVGIVLVGVSVLPVVVAAQVVAELVGVGIVVEA